MLAVKDSGVKRQHMIETNVHPRLEFEIIKERKQTKKLTNTPNSVYHGPSQIKEESRVSLRFHQSHQIWEFVDMGKD